MSFEDIIVSSTIRELEEETNVENIEPETDMQFLTVIHDRSNAVGRVHVGLGGVVIVEPTMDVKSNEPEKIVGSMTSLASLRDKIKKDSIDLEIWSDILLQNIGY
jgi:predicted NUDIX family phosphoesterase